MTVRRPPLTARMLTVPEAAQRVGRSAGTVRRWVREGTLPATADQGRIVIDTADLDLLRDGLYPVLTMPEEWKCFEDGTPVPNWVAAVAASRHGR